MSASQQPSSSLTEWSKCFHVFLLESNYNTPNAKLTLKHLNNLYNLLFVPAQRGEQQKVFGPPPAAKDVVEQMFDAQLLIKGEDDIVKFPNPCRKDES